MRRLSRCESGRRRLTRVLARGQSLRRPVHSVYCQASVRNPGPVHCLGCGSQACERLRLMISHAVASTTANSTIHAMSDHAQLHSRSIPDFNVAVSSERLADARRGGPPRHASMIRGVGLAVERGLDVLRLRVERRSLRGAYFLPRLCVYLVDESTQCGEAVREIEAHNLALVGGQTRP